MFLLDANAVLRYILDDVPKQASEAQAAIEAGAEVTIEVMAECVYVLKEVYGLPRDVLSNALSSFMDDVDCVRWQVAVTALSGFGSSNLDFVDCVLLAEAKANGRKVLTFDKKLKKAIEQA